MTDELARLWTARPDWYDNAACRGMGPTLFFPTRGENQHPALQVCEDCPVRVECGLAGRDEPFGLWGGMGGRRRAVIRRAERPDEIRPGPRPGTQRKPINHGTLGGAQAHRRRGERPCRECLDAQSRHQQIMRKPRRKVA